MEKSKDLQYVQDISSIVTILQQHEQQYIWGLWEDKVTLVLNFSENKEGINKIGKILTNLEGRTGIEIVRNDEFEINEETGELRLIDRSYKRIKL